MGAFHLQNTGTTTWPAGAICFGFHGWEQIGLNQTGSQLATTLAQSVPSGEDTSINFFIYAPGSAKRGEVYRLRFDMFLDDSFGDISFSEAEAGRPWPTYDVTICIEAYLVYLPTILK